MILSWNFGVYCYLPSCCQMGLTSLFWAPKGHFFQASAGLDCTYLSFSTSTSFLTWVQTPWEQGLLFTYVSTPEHHAWSSGEIHTHLWTEYMEGRAVSGRFRLLDTEVLTIGCGHIFLSDSDFLLLIFGEILKTLSSSLQRLLKTKQLTNWLFDL